MVFFLLVVNNIDFSVWKTFNNLSKSIGAQLNLLFPIRRKNSMNPLINKRKKIRYIIETTRNSLELTVARCGNARCLFSRERKMQQNSIQNIDCDNQKKTNDLKMVSFTRISWPPRFVISTEWKQNKINSPVVIVEHRCRSMHNKTTQKNTTHNKNYLQNEKKINWQFLSINRLSAAKRYITP